MYAIANIAKVAEVLSAIMQILKDYVVKFRLKEAPLQMLQI